MTTDTFLHQAESFLTRHGRRAWWQVMGDHGVDTLAGAIEKRDRIAETMRDIDAITSGLPGPEA